MPGVSELVLLLVMLAMVVATVLAIVIGVVRGARRKTFAQLRAQIDQDVVVRESPFVGGSIRYRDYRAPGMYTGAGIRAMRAALVLTRKELVIFRARTLRIPYADLAKYSASTLDGKLVLATDQPPGATGHIAYHFRVSDADEWVTALRGAGAQGASL
jgi:hypothetical protein